VDGASASIRVGRAFLAGEVTALAGLTGAVLHHAGRRSLSGPRTQR